MSRRKEEGYALLTAVFTIFLLSIALALLAADWARGRNATLLCFIVDHGLRAEATTEAQQVRRWLESRSLHAEILSDDPVADFANARAETIATFAEEGVIEKTGPSLGIAFGDQLLHGWDLARATGQDATMPEGLAEAAYEMIHGAFTEDQRKGVFKPEVPVPADASAQDKLLAYTGRDPAA